MSFTTTTSAAGVAWDLGDLFAGVDDPAINATLDQCSSEADTFAATYRGTVNVAGGPAADHLRAALEQLETLYDRLSAPMSYASLLFAADTSQPAHRNLQQHIEQRYTEINNKLLFFELEWLELDDATAQRLLDDPALANYRHYLHSARRYKAHTLSEPEERIINEKNVTGAQAWQQLFSELTSALAFPMEREGETHTLTLDAVLSEIRSNPDRSIREQAHTVLYNTLATQSQIFAYIYNTLMLDHLTMDRLRHYPDPMMPRHLANEIDPETVETMMRVVEENVDIPQSYYKLKARLLNVPKLQMYDQYAPVEQSRVVMPYTEAQEIILESFGAFDPAFRTHANDFFEKHWIDAELRPGKRGGAFCSGYPPSKHPYILCNYTDNLRDVLTVAHELGHGIHFCLSKQQTLFNFMPTLPLCETASVFGEMLVFEHLLQRQQDNAARLPLVCSKIEDIFATVFRQTVLTRFEQAAFASRKQSRLTPEQLNDHWLEVNGRYYGDAVEMTSGYAYGWSYIPHFIHTRFYCYSYVFGELLVLALYGMYREQGAAFVPRYKALLEAGGRKSPDELLAMLNVDTRDSAFWQLGFNELRRLVNYLHELVG
jgi:oligoendopeptidase F